MRLRFTWTGSTWSTVLMAFSTWDAQNAASRDPWDNIITVVEMQWCIQGMLLVPNFIVINWVGGINAASTIQSWGGLPQDALAGSLGMEYVLVILIIFLPKKRNPLQREGGGIDALSKDAPHFCQMDGVCARHGTPKEVRRPCSHEGCTKQAQIQGVCVTHGAKTKHCSHEGCEPCLWWMYEPPKNQAVHASRVYQWWAAGVVVPIPWCKQKRAIILVDVPAGPLTMLGFVQIMVEWGRQWENLAVVRGAKNKLKIRVLVSSMLQKWNLAAMGLWREEYAEDIVHIMRLVGTSSSSEVTFFWHRDVYHHSVAWQYSVMKSYIMGLRSIVGMKGVCLLYTNTDPNRVCTFTHIVEKWNRIPPPHLSQRWISFLVETP